MREFLAVARVCVPTGRFERLGITLNAWMATAEAYASGLSPTGVDLDYLDRAEGVPDPRT